MTKTDVARLNELLEKQVALMEEGNELQRESNQLLGELLTSVDALNARSVAGVDAQATNVLAEASAVETPPVPDESALVKAMFGPSDADVAAAPEQPLEFDVQRPKPNPRARVPKDWVRVKVKHPSKESLEERLAKGCLCGRPIILKDHDGGAFHTCEALTSKGSCAYRPAAYFDSLTFLTNVPPKV